MKNLRKFISTHHANQPKIELKQPTREARSHMPQLPPENSHSLRRFLIILTPQNLPQNPLSFQSLFRRSSASKAHSNKLECHEQIPRCRQDYVVHLPRRLLHRTPSKHENLVQNEDHGDEIEGNEASVGEEEEKIDGFENFAELEVRRCEDFYGL